MVLVVHIPNLDGTVTAAAPDHIVLIELVKLVSLSVFSGLELVRSHVLEIKGFKAVIRRVTGFQLDGDAI